MKILVKEIKAKIRVSDGISGENYSPIEEDVSSKSLSHLLECSNKILFSAHRITSKLGFSPLLSSEREAIIIHLSGALTEEEIQFLQASSDSSFIHRVNFYKKELDKLGYFISYSQIIVKYAQAMGHSFRISVDIS